MASESTQTEIQDSHKPPAIGSPAWISISATQVSRAKKFYEEVFGWKFMSNTGNAAEKMAVFGIPGAPTLLGGIGFVEEQEMENKKGDRGIVLYMRVESVEGTLEKAKSAGGEVVKEMWVEGNHTQLGQFKDTEGNLVGVLKWGNFGGK